MNLYYLQPDVSDRRAGRSLGKQKPSQPAPAHSASAVSVYVMLGKNPLCQNSFPVQEN